jgi:pimeloyl-ACP methyl ester carboxylesterase
MAALLDAVGARQAIVGGLSLGGYVSLAFHRAHPERVRALLIFDTGPGFKNPDSRAAWNRTAEATALELEEKGLAALRSRSAERRLAEHRDASGLVLAARNLLTQLDALVIESLPAIAVPTLVLVGADDAPFLAATDVMASKIAGSTKVVIPGAGHAANLDQPEAFNRAVRGFLEEHGL